MPQIPVTVIGGYLGAGKTTLVNHLLRQADGLRLAVLVNEFGELPIDADLIESQDDNVINIAGGCVCCSYGSDLMAALIELDQRQPAPEHLLIEASGVALPKAIAQSVQLMQHFVIDGIVVMTDAETVKQHGSDPYLSDTIARQLASADIVILNKTDLVGVDACADTRQWLAGQATDSRVIETVGADVPLAVLLGSDLKHLIADDQVGRSHHLDHATHETAIFRIDHPLDPEELAKQLAAPELDLIRSKGFVQALDGRMRALQTVGRRWEVTDAPATVGVPGRIVCISHTSPIDADVISRMIATMCQVFSPGL